MTMLFIRWNTFFQKQGVFIRRLLTVGVLVFAVAGTISLLSSVGPSEKAAFKAAQSYILSLEDVPSNAEFLPLTDGIRSVTFSQDLGDDVYAVQGRVFWDSTIESNFLIRWDYYAKLQYVDGEWKAIEYRLQ